MEKEYSLELDLHTFRKTFVYSSILAILGVVVSMGLTSCCRDGFVPRDGDLLFCIGGDSPMSDAITSSTSTSESVRYDHVAIFATLDGIPSVIEADPKYGVRVTDWEEFISQAQTVGGKPGIDVMRIQEDIDIDAAIGRALGFRQSLQNLKRSSGPSGCARIPRTGVRLVLLAVKWTDVLL